MFYVMFKSFCFLFVFNVIYDQTYAEIWDISLMSRDNEENEARKLFFYIVDGGWGGTVLYVNEYNIQLKSFEAEWNILGLHASVRKDWTKSWELGKFILYVNDYKLELKSFEADIVLLRLTSVRKDWTKNWELGKSVGSEGFPQGYSCVLVKINRAVNSTFAELFTSLAQRFLSSPELLRCNTSLGSNTGSCER